MAADRQYNEPKVKQLVKEWFDARGAFSWAPVSNGFGVHGIPDRVGCVPITITPEMVGKRIGVFVGIEAKGAHRKREKAGGLTPQQVLRIKEIQNAAGVAGVVYGPEELGVFSYMVGQWLTR